MKILITGGAGFVGSNLAINLKNKYKDYTVTCIDNLKRRGSELNLNKFNRLGIRFNHVDIRHKEDLECIDQFDILIDACADPSVLSGVNSPVKQVVDTNLIGTMNCLELAKKFNANFIFLSTSRVYPIVLLNNINYTENDTRFQISKNQSMAGVSLNGIGEDFSLSGSRTFYGFTKYTSELLIEEYNYYSNIKYVINRCGVISGPGQMGKIDQGILTFWLSQHYWKKKLKYIGFGGSGKQLRDILYIGDLFELIDYQIHNMKTVNGKLFNVGGGNYSNASLLELTNICENITGNKLEIESLNETRIGDIRLYITDNSKVEREIGWRPTHNVNDILEKTFSWMVKNEKELKNVLI